jgi:hypothetical protein
MGKAKERIAYKLKMGLLPGLNLRLGLQTQQPGIVREKVANSSTTGLLSAISEFEQEPWETPFLVVEA